MIFLVIPFLTSSAEPEAVEVVLYVGPQFSDVLSEMIAAYNALGKGYTVYLLESTWEIQSQHDTYVTKFIAEDNSFDIIEMDVIWPPEFAAAGWLEQVDDLFEGVGYTEDLYLEGAIQAKFDEDKA